jgi:hypothetical protein
MDLSTPVAKPESRSSDHHERNAGTKLLPDWFEDIAVNRSPTERRAPTLTTRRTVKKEYQAAWLIKAITCIDLTTLTGDDTAGRVRRLCAKARRPVRDDILQALGLADAGMNWLILMKEELGLPWMQPDLFRLGASSMLADIERQLEHYVTGRYSASSRHALA